VDLSEFLAAELPPPPARVLEVGCGHGALAHALAAAGHAVLAIDPEAPGGPIFRRSTIEELDEPATFDAVVASRSLHHVDDLVVALQKIAALLRPDGVVIIDEFGWERLDGPSAEQVGIALEEWREEHAELHTAEAMIRELDARFTRRSFSWEPYLHRESRQAVTEEEERRLIGEGRLQATGFRYVGVGRR
jgi:2-polyprenyl-3-methyl-5-hydroxy-6-metoxy-1,4-benzoquinol methylase